jgi:predicted dehydrogenase
VTVAALEKDYHVFCEKPPGRDLADIARVIACEKERPRLRLKYGFNHRYHDSVSNALDIVGSGDLGRVINIRGVYGKSVMINFQSDWRTKREIAGGGILLDQGIHMVDLMRLFGGEFTEINSVVSNSFWNHDVEDNAYALMRSKSGVVAMLHSSATEWRHRFQLDITLENGSITLNGILSGSKSYGEETMTVARTNGVFDGDPEEHITIFKHDSSWALEIAEFADAIRTETPIVNGSSQDAFNTMKLVYDIYCADPDWKQRWNLDNGVPDSSA